MASTRRISGRGIKDSMLSWLVSGNKAQLITHELNKTLDDCY
jgi:hypothetical protein